MVVPSLIGICFAPSSPMTSPNGSKAARVNGSIVSFFIAIPTSRQRAEKPQPRYATVRINIEPHVRDRTQCSKLRLEHMLLVHLQLLFTQQHRPEHGLRSQRAVRPTRNTRRLQRTPVRIIS